MSRFYSLVKITLVTPYRIDIIAIYAQNNAIITFLEIPIYSVGWLCDFLFNGCFAGAISDHPVLKTYLLLSEMLHCKKTQFQK